MAVEIQDSNIAWLGSDLEKQVRLAAARTERQWDGAGQKPGLEIWRIEKFAVKRWPEKKYGTFFSGDSFIALHTFKEGSSPKLLFDVFFWLGKFTSQDEAAVAAYKTVELDDLLGTVPVQYREVQGHESQKFRSVFPRMNILDGGIESGFNHVKPDEYVPRLLQVKGKRGAVAVAQVEKKASSLNQGDVFILDCGLQIFQWNGDASGVFEKRKATEVISDIKQDRRGKAKSSILDGLERDATFWGHLGSMSDVKSASEGGDDTDSKDYKKMLFQLSDAGGSLTLSVKDDDGRLARKDLDQNDVFLVDIGTQIYVWIGQKASKAERAKGMKYAVDYLTKSGRPLFTPVTRVVAGGETEAFWRCFDE